jgi:uncharacterized membrane protein
MAMLIAGVLFWSLVHFMPSAATGLKQRLVGGLGENGYKGVFGLCIIGAVLLMVFGWKTTDETALYSAPEWGGMVTLLAMLGTSITFFAPYIASNVGRLMRHPQLLGIVLFGTGHLFAVGHLRSVVLFGGLALWALAEIILINRRDGAWVKPDPVPRGSDFKLFLAGFGFFLLFLFTHEGLFGVAALPA